MEHAQAETQVLGQRLEERAAHRLADFLLDLRVPAELDPRATLGLGPLDARAHEIVGAKLDVRAQLRVHVGVDRGAPKELVDRRAKVGQELHASPGRAARTEAMAVARRFHPSVSSRSRPRPAAVSS